MNARTLKNGLRNPHLVARFVKNLIDDGRFSVVSHLQGDNNGRYVMDEDWDNLVILDACRYDTFEKFNPLPGTSKKAISRGEVTARFIEENFAEREYYDTVYVCGNAAVGNRIEHVDVYKFLGLWTDQKLKNFDRTYRDVVPPELVVQKSIEMHERYPDKRLISHFLQPHPPFIVKDGEHIPKGSKYRDFTAARKGEVSPSEIKAVYEENIEYVLKHVERLVEELPGKTVVTADHGELLGEGIPLFYEILHPRWSLWNRNKFDYAHYTHLRLPELIEVPWVEIEDKSRREITAASRPVGIEMNEDIVEDRLEALGYR